MQWKNRVDCSKPTPRFITTASGMHCLRWNSASAAICNPDHSIPITDGSNANGKFAKGRKESPFACRCRSKEPPRPTAPKTTTEPQTRYAFRFRAYWFVLAQTEG